MLSICPFMSILISFWIQKSVYHRMRGMILIVDESQPGACGFIQSQ